jgi:hypothetical protein
MLFIAAEKRSCSTTRAILNCLQPGRRAQEIRHLPGIAHYGIYGEAREQVTRLAIDWFDAHLKK